jgi:hypothetical protein
LYYSRDLPPRPHPTPLSPGFVLFDDFFRIMKKKSDNPLDDLDDDEE